MKSIPAALAMLLASPCLLAQTNPMPSPEIDAAAGTVTFRLTAPKAREVTVRGQWDRKTVPMERDGQGIWSLTAPDVPAGVWEYSFVVDGLSMIDPLNPDLKPQRNPRSSILHLPSDPLAPWDFQDVPHGAVHRHDFRGQAAGRPREVWIYTPPGYEKAAAESYPLLVLQHGSGDNQKTWVEHGKAHWILDNLIAAGTARPMIVVMLDGHPLGKVPKEDAGRRTAAMRAFQRELLEEALPLVEARYRVSRDREQRAIAGLSMGGGQALATGLNHLETFAWIGSFSGAVDEPEIRAPLADGEGTSAKLKLLWIACGNQDFLLGRNEELVKALEQRGIAHTWRLTEGDHSWPVWRGYLAEFAPLLFQD